MPRSLFQAAVRLTALCFLVSLFGISAAQAQHATLTFGATGGVPTNDFGDELDRVAFGVTGSFLYGVGPISAGVEGALMNYDRQAALLAPVVADGTAVIGDVTSASGIHSLHAVVRLQLPEGPVQPYVDGLVGFQRFTSKTSFAQTVLMVSDIALLAPGGTRYTQRVSSLDSDDVALSYGGGAGVLLRLAQGHDQGVPFQAFLDLGARYVIGEAATFQVAGTDAETGEPIFGAARSRTNLIRPQVSLVITLGR